MLDLKISKGIKIEPPRIIIYGDPGIGKTSWASQASNPLFFDLQDGSSHLDVARYKPKTYEDMVDAINQLISQEHDYRYLVLDTIGDVEELLHENILRKYGASSRNDPKCPAFGYGKWKDIFSNHWRQFRDKLDELRAKKNMGIIIIGHRVAGKIRDPMNETYIKNVVCIDEQAWPLLQSWADSVLFATDKIEIESEDIGFKKTINRAQSHGRVLYTLNSGSFEAKNRYGHPYEIPLDWKVFISGVHKYFNEKVIKPEAKAQQPQETQ